MRTSWMDRFRTPLKQWDLFDALPRTRSPAQPRGSSARGLFITISLTCRRFSCCGHTPCAQVMHCIRAHTNMNRIRRETLFVEVASDCWEIHTPLLSPDSPGIRSNQTCTWWRHQMETFSALLVFCVGGNSMVTGEFPAQRPVMWSFDVFFYLGLKKQLSKQSRRWWFGTQSHSFWHHFKESQLLFTRSHKILFCYKLLSVFTNYMFQKR